MLLVAWILIGVGVACFAASSGVAFVLLLVTGLQNLRDWRRRRSTRNYPWFPPEWHPDADFELPDAELEMFTALTARPHWTRAGRVSSR